MKLSYFIYAFILTFFGFLFRSLLNHSFIDALTPTDIFSYFSFFCVMLVVFNIIERRNKKD